MVDLKLTDLTNGAITIEPDGKTKVWTGTGIFDVLIHAVNKNLEIQYLNQRINGNDYAEVYASSLIAVLQQAVNYALQEKQVEEQIRLTYTQRVKVDKETALLGLDDVIRIANITPDNVYTPKYKQTEATL